jgi:uncharacterized membrane protein YuzA (DUF378 family)
MSTTKITSTFIFPLLTSVRLLNIGFQNIFLTPTVDTIIDSILNKLFYVIIGIFVVILVGVVVNCFQMITLKKKNNRQD